MRRIEGAVERESIEQMVQPDDVIAGRALGFYRDAMEQFDDQVLVGEYGAKLAVVAGLVLRENVLLSGLPGGGKSTLGNHFYRIIEDFDAKDMVMIPGQHDLTATQLVGGKIENSRVIQVEPETDGGEWTTRKEVQTHFVNGMVNEHVKGLRLEEPNRAPAHALQSILPVLENRRMETSAGWVELPNLLTVVATMNPSESRESTFKISNAMASRFALGAEMGTTEDMSFNQRVALQRDIRRFHGRPESVEPIISTQELENLNSYTSRAVVPKNKESFLDNLTVVAADKLKENGVVETDRRIGGQILRVSKVLASLRNPNNIVGDEDANDALHLVVGARIGALKTHRSKSAQEIAEDIMAEFKE